MDDVISIENNEHADSRQRKQSQDIQYQEQIRQFNSTKPKVYAKKKVTFSNKL